MHTTLTTGRLKGAIKKAQLHFDTLYLELQKQNAERAATDSELTSDNKDQAEDDLCTFLQEKSRRDIATQRGTTSRCIKDAAEDLIEATIAALAPASTPSWEKERLYDKLTESRNH